MYSLDSSTLREENIKRKVERIPLFIIQVTFQTPHNCWLCTMWKINYKQPVYINKSINKQINNLNKF